LKVALIGCGGRGTGAAHNCLGSNQNMKLVATADAFAKPTARATKFLVKKFPDKTDVPPERIFVGFDAYQKAIDCGVDMVILATPPGFRPIHYAAAVRAGKHVFMEKPCCVDAPGFRSLMESNKLADEKGLKVVVGLQRRHEAKYINGINRIHDGQFGELILLQAYWNGGGVWVKQREPKETEMQYQMRNWYYFVWLCGDHICEQHVHNLDICNWAMNAHPIEANGMGGREVRKGKDVGQIFDHHFVEFTYPSGAKLYSQCRHIRGCWSRVGEAVFGTKGKGRCTSSGPVRKAAGPYDQEHIELVNAIRNDEPLNAGWYGATSSMTAVLGRMATYSGQIVEWEDAVAKGPDEMPQQFAWDADPPVLPDEEGNYPVPIPGLNKPY
jgi:predicted dehydrogenase